jgi:hypothetical protein
MSISKFAGFRYRRYAVATRLVVVLWLVLASQIYFTGERLASEALIATAVALVVAAPGLVLASGFSASASRAFAGARKHAR